MLLHLVLTRCLVKRINLVYTIVIEFLIFGCYLITAVNIVEDYDTYSVAMLCILLVIIALICNVLSAVLGLFVDCYNKCHRKKKEKVVSIEIPETKQLNTNRHLGAIREFKIALRRTYLNTHIEKTQLNIEDDIIVNRASPVDSISFRNGPSNIEDHINFKRISPVDSISFREHPPEIEEDSIFHMRNDYHMNSAANSHVSYLEIDPE